MRYQFPKNMNLNIQPYMMFNSYQWRMNGRKTQTTKSHEGTTVDTIILPVPGNGITDTVVNNWEEGFGLGGNYTQALVGNILSTGLNTLGDLGKFLGADRGQLINDYAGLLFRGTGFRTFEFSFTFIPKNVAEANEIAEIEKAFKRNTLPHYGKRLISYPNFFRLSLVFPNNKDVIKFRSCVVTSCTVNKFTDGMPSIMKDGSPQKVELSIAVIELQKIDREDFS